MKRSKIFSNIKFTVIKKLHRLIIWSYVKEKILEKPLIGHGFFSSRNIANKMKETQNGTKFQLIPLHPHNGILQIWFNNIFFFYKTYF